MIEFPDPRTAGEDGLLAVGGDLRVDTLRSAYSQGIFPWPQEGLPLLWYSPPRRGVLEFADVHWPRRFQQEMRARPLRVTFNQAFAQVIHECAAIPRVHEKGTWILPPIEGAYTRLHREGFAHSVECWAEDGSLIGGLYGVFIDGVFAGESMFHKESGASKRCLFTLVEKLRLNGLSWIDTQMVTPVLESFGGKYITREHFLERLDEVHSDPVAKSRKLVLE